MLGDDVHGTYLAREVEVAMKPPTPLTFSRPAPMTAWWLGTSSPEGQGTNPEWVIQPLPAQQPPEQLKP